MDLFNKLEQVSRHIRIEGAYMGYETICIRNVNQTFEVKFILPDGKKKPFLAQIVNIYAFRQPIQLMENIDMLKKMNQMNTIVHGCVDAA